MVVAPVAALRRVGEWVDPHERPLFRSPAVAITDDMQPFVMSIALDDHTDGAASSAVAVEGFRSPTGEQQ